MSLINDQLQHEVYIQRFATELLKSKLFPSLKEADDAVRALLGEYDQIKSAAQVRKIEKLINAIVTDTVSVAWQESTKELEGLAVYEADYYANLVGGYADLVLEHPSARNIADYMRSALMALGEGERVKVGAWADFVQQNTDGLAQQYNNLVKAGYARGASVGQIRRTIQMYSQGLAKQQVTALARTGAQHYANSAREAMAQDNADIIKKRYFLSVLDNRTTIGCRALHGKTWDIDDDKYVRLPRHVNCRSSYLYLLEGQDKPEGRQIAIGSGKDYPTDAENKPTYKGRRSGDIFDIERVNAGTTADSWLRSQSEAFIIDSLGPTRAKLFIAGEPLERMADAFGNPLTLEQIRQRDAEAFKRAGLGGSNMLQAKFHPEYQLTIDAVQSVRDAVAGSVFVKDKSTDYLPNPSEIDTTSPDAVARYNRYLQGAEWDAYPEQTLRSMLGKLRVDDAVVELPDSVAYLNEDTDGDGMSLKAMMQQSSSELLQVKWQCLVADYQGLTDIAIDDISVAELSQINARAVIKGYTRENVVYWHFSRISGKLQMSYLMLREIGSIFDQSTLLDKAVVSYLVLALDEEGNYYQQKYAQHKDGGLTEGPRNYVFVGGSPLKWLPIQFAMDEQGVTGKLPKELGFLAPICDLTYARYQMSAEYKEAMRSMPPTRDVLGLAGTKMDQFKEANGRSYYATGANAVNFLPEGVSVELNSANMEVEFYERYFTANEDKIRSLGGVIVSDSSSDKTATEVSTNAAEQNARLTSVADGIEFAYKRIISYCMMFEGAASQDNVEQSMELVTLELNRDFAAAKLSTDEVRAVQELVLNGLITRKMAIEKLLAGGWLMGDIEQILADLEQEV